MKVLISRMLHGCYEEHGKHMEQSGTLGIADIILVTVSCTNLRPTGSCQTLIAASAQGLDPLLLCPMKCLAELAGRAASRVFGSLGKYFCRASVYINNLMYKCITKFTGHVRSSDLSMKVRDNEVGGTSVFALLSSQSI